MDADAKKTALRMIPYGIYVLTSEGKDGKSYCLFFQPAVTPPSSWSGSIVTSGRHQKQPASKRSVEP